METIFVWCTFADTDTFTRFDGATHFCSMCGATDHAEIKPVSNPDPINAEEEPFELENEIFEELHSERAVYLPPDISGSMDGNDHRW